MRSHFYWLPAAATGVITGMLLAACDGAPSESDLVAACMKEGASPAQQVRDRQMRVDRDTFCKCAAREAGSLSADSQRATVLSMEGRKEEARAITAKMTGPEQEAHMKGGLLVMKKCMRGTP